MRQEIFLLCQAIEKNILKEHLIDFLASKDLKFGLLQLLKRVDYDMLQKFNPLYRNYFLITPEHLKTTESCQQWYHLAYSAARSLWIVDNLLLSELKDVFNRIYDQGDGLLKAYENLYKISEKQFAHRFVTVFLQAIIHYQQHLAQNENFAGMFLNLINLDKSYLETDKPLYLQPIPVVAEDELQTAITAGNFFSVQDICSKGKMDSLDLAQAAQLAAVVGQYKILVYLLKQEPYLSAEFLSYALKIAIFYGHGDIVRHLVQYGASLEADDRITEHGLSLAISIGRLDLVADLIHFSYSTPEANEKIKQLNKDAFKPEEVNLEAYFSFSPLVVAAESGQLHVLDYLLNYEDSYSAHRFVFSLDTSNADGHSLPMIAAKGDLAMLVYLQNKFNYSAQRDAQGNTLAHVAARFNQDKILLWLDGIGFNLNTENAVQETPLDVAALHDNGLAFSALMRLSDEKALLKPKLGRILVTHNACKVIEQSFQYIPHQLLIELVKEAFVSKKDGVLKLLLAEVSRKESVSFFMEELLKQAIHLNYPFAISQILNIVKNPEIYQYKHPFKDTSVNLLEYCILVKQPEVLVYFQGLSWNAEQRAKAIHRAIMMQYPQIIAQIAVPMQIALLERIGLTNFLGNKKNALEAALMMPKVAKDTLKEVLETGSLSLSDYKLHFNTVKDKLLHNIFSLEEPLIRRFNFANYASMYRDAGQAGHFFKQLCDYLQSLKEKNRTEFLYELNLEGCKLLSADLAKLLEIMDSFHEVTVFNIKNNNATPIQLEQVEAFLERNRREQENRVQGIDENLQIEIIPLDYEVGFESKENSLPLVIEFPEIMQEEQKIIANYLSESSVAQDGLEKHDKNLSRIFDGLNIVSLPMYQLTSPKLLFSMDSFVKDAQMTKKLMHRFMQINSQQTNIEVEGISPTFELSLAKIYLKIMETNLLSLGELEANSSKAELVIQEPQISLLKVIYASFCNDWQIKGVRGKGLVNYCIHTALISRLIQDVYITTAEKLIEKMLDEVHISQPNLHASFLYLRPLTWLKLYDCPYAINQQTVSRLFREFKAKICNKNLVISQLTVEDLIPAKHLNPLFTLVAEVLLGDNWQDFYKLKTRLSKKEHIMNLPADIAAKIEEFCHVIPKEQSLIWLKELAHILRQQALFTHDLSPKQRTICQVLQWSKDDFKQFLLQTTLQCLVSIAYFRWEAEVVTSVEILQDYERLQHRLQHVATECLLKNDGILLSLVSNEDSLRIENIQKHLQELSASQRDEAVNQMLHEAVFYNDFGCELIEMIMTTPELEQHIHYARLVQHVVVQGYDNILEKIVNVLKSTKGKQIAHQALVEIFNARDKKGKTLSHECCIYGQGLILNWLLINGFFDMQSRCDLGCTPLMYAARFGHLNLVKYLLYLGAELHTFDSQGLLVLHHAVASHNQDLVAFLLDYVNYAFLNRHEKIRLLHYALDVDYRVTSTLMGVCDMSLIPNEHKHILLQRALQQYQDELLGCLMQGHFVPGLIKQALYLKNPQGQLLILTFLLKKESCLKKHELHVDLLPFFLNLLPQLKLDVLDLSGFGPQTLAQHYEEICQLLTQNIKLKLSFDTEQLSPRQLKSLKDIFASQLIIDSKEPVVEEHKNALVRHSIFALSDSDVSSEQKSEERRPNFYSDNEAKSEEISRRLTHGV